MTGLEIIVLAPLAYGVLHLGKKVIEQREIIDNQMETLAQQQLALEAQRAAAATGTGTTGHSSEGFLGKAMMLGSLSLAGAVTAYNLYQIRNSSGRGQQPENSSDESTPSNSNTNTLATSTEVPNREGSGGLGGDSINTHSSNTNSHNNTQTERGFFSTLLTRALSPSPSPSDSSANKRRNNKKRTHVPPANYQPQVALSEAEECKVCLHNQRDTLVTPCNHFALCWECAEVICFGSSKASGRPIGGQCPVCRAPISSLQFAYV